MLKRLAADPNRANPSWCFDVIMMCRMPADFAVRTHSRASNAAGLKRAATFSYSEAGIRARFIIHSLMP